MSSSEPPDPRAKYRVLPPVINAADVVESVDSATDIAEGADTNDGARPYLRMTLGPWVR